MLDNQNKVSQDTSQPKLSVNQNTKSTKTLDNKDFKSTKTLDSQSTRKSKLLDKNTRQPKYCTINVAAFITHLSIVFDCCSCFKISIMFWNVFSAGFKCRQVEFLDFGANSSWRFMGFPLTAWLSTCFWNTVQTAAFPVFCFRLKYGDSWRRNTFWRRNAKCWMDWNSWYNFFISIWYKLFILTSMDVAK